MSISALHIEDAQLCQSVEPYASSLVVDSVLMQHLKLHMHFSLAKKWDIGAVLSLAEMELVLPMASFIVCYAVVAGRVLITHQCFGYC